MIYKKYFYLLCWALILQSLGNLLISLFYNNTIEYYLFLEKHINENTSYIIDCCLSVSIFSLSVLFLYKRQFVILICISMYYFFVSLIKARFSGIEHKELIVFTNGARYLMPLGMIFILQSKNYFKIFNHNNLEYFIKIALSLTFFFHGYKALFGFAEYIDYILILSDRILNVQLSEFYAQNILFVIGLIDIACVFFILSKQEKYSLMYMTLWGFLTAFMRLIFYGNLFGLTQFLIRQFHWIGPLYLIICNHYKLKERKIFEN